MDYSMPDFLHYLPEFTQTHVHWVDDTIQLCHPLLPSSTPAPNLAQQAKNWIFYFKKSCYYMIKLLTVTICGSTTSLQNTHIFAGGVWMSETQKGRVWAQSLMAPQASISSSWSGEESRELRERMLRNALRAGFQSHLPQHHSLSIKKKINSFILK